jgi:hypothetical protein
VLRYMDGKGSTEATLLSASVAVTCMLIGAEGANTCPLVGVVTVTTGKALELTKVPRRYIETMSASEIHSVGGPVAVTPSVASG